MCSQIPEPENGYRDWDGPSGEKRRNKYIEKRGPVFHQNRKMSVNMLGQKPGVGFVVERRAVRKYGGELREKMPHVLKIQMK
jgi:hypothetical protein